MVANFTYFTYIAKQIKSLINKEYFRAKLLFLIDMFCIRETFFYKN